MTTPGNSVSMATKGYRSISWRMRENSYSRLLDQTERIKMTFLQLSNSTSAGHGGWRGFSAGGYRNTGGASSVRVAVPMEMEEDRDRNQIDGRDG